MRPWCPISLCVLCFFLSTTTTAKTVGESSFATQAPADSFTEQCLVEIVAHPLGQGIATHDLDEYVDFCTCLREKTQSEKKTDEFLNPDTERHLGSIDRCAALSLSKSNLERYFLILITTKFELFVYEKIRGRFPAGTAATASPSSMATRIECIQKNILHTCTKVYAFGLTYQCIQDVFRSPIPYGKAEALCPTLSTDDLTISDQLGGNML